MTIAALDLALALALPSKALNPEHFTEFHKPGKPI
jgi:hypothetical protein